MAIPNLVESSQNAKALWHGRPLIKGILQISIIHSQSKMRLYCSKNRYEYKQSDCIKARNHTLIDFLHLSRNRYVYFRNRATKVGMLHRTWWLLTLAHQGRLHRALNPKLYATRKLCMNDFLKLHHNCDAYMGVQKER